MLCSHCNQEIPVAGNFCPACGTACTACSTPEPVPLTPPGRSHLAYLLLGFFLAGLGIHNFYAGRIERGIAQLLLTVLSMGMFLWISGVWTAIELYQTRTDRDGIAFRSPHPKLAKLLGLLLFLPVLAILAGTCLPACSKARAAAQTVRCAGNLKKIYHQLQLYAENNAGWLPPDLPVTKALACPAGNTYLFIARGLRLEDLSNRTPILLEEHRALHRNRTGHALFADGRVGDGVRGGCTYQAEANMLSGNTAPPALLRQAGQYDRTPSPADNQSDKE